MSDYYRSSGGGRPEAPPDGNPVPSLSLSLLCDGSKHPTQLLSQQPHTKLCTSPPTQTDTHRCWSLSRHACSRVAVVSLPQMKPPSRCGLHVASVEPNCTRLVLHWAHSALLSPVSTSVARLLPTPHRPLCDTRSRHAHTHTDVRTRARYTHPHRHGWIGCVVWAVWCSLSGVWIDGLMDCDFRSQWQVSGQTRRTRLVSPSPSLSTHRHHFIPLLRGLDPCICMCVCARARVCV
jgi:hypothetical protein